MALLKWTDADTSWGDLTQLWGLVEEVVTVVEAAGSSPTARKKRLEKQ